MRQVLLAVLILALWCGLTTAAIAITPDRGEDLPDLVDDPHWLLRTPPNPVQYDKPVRVVPATTTTTTRFTTPGPTARAAAPRPPPATRPNNAGVEQWRGLVASYPGWNVDTMLRIMRCESGGNPNAVGVRVYLKGIAYRAYGLMQDIALDGRPGELLDPGVNVGVAYDKWVAGGLSHWSSSRSCWG